MRKTLLKLTATLFLVAFFTFQSEKAQASHAAGGELIYNHIQDSTYQFIYKFYRFCGGIPAPSSVDLCGKNNCTFNTISSAMPAIAVIPGVGPNGSPVDPGCAGFPTVCTGGTLPGYEEWWYADTVTIPSSCNIWTFSVGISARNPSNNLTGNANLYTEVTFNNALSHNNSSPRFLNPPVPYVCRNTPFSFNHLGFDPDGDSLVYYNINPLDGPSSCTGAAPSNVPYSGTYSTNTPLATAATGPFTFNQNTGSLTFTPSANGYWAMATKVEEYRNGILIGSAIRDIQVVVISNCPNINPGTAIDTTGFTGQLVGGYIRGCTNEALDFCFRIYSPDTAVSFAATSTNATIIPASTLNFTGVGTDSLTGCFSWTPTNGDVGIHTFTVTARDTSCRPPGIVSSQTFSYSILIPAPQEGYGDTSICSLDTAMIHGGSQLGDSLVWSVISGDNNSLSCTSCDTAIVYPSVTTKYKVTNINSICESNSDTVTVTIIPPPLVDIGYDDTLICQNSTVTFSPTLTPPGAYNYMWSPNANITSTNTLNTTVSPIVDTWYYLDVTEQNAGCYNRDSVLVRVIPIDMQVTDPSLGICEGENVQINMTGSAPDSFTYVWTPGVSLSDSTSMSPVATPDTTTTYIVDIMRDGCQTYNSYAIVTVEPNPIVDLGPDLTLCQWDTTFLQPDIQPTWFTTYDYTWSNSTFLVPNDVPDPTIIADIPGIQNYTLTVTTPLGCAGSDDLELSVFPGDFMTVDPEEAEICSQESVKLGAAGAASYVWTPGLYLDDSTLAEPTSTPKSSIEYTVYGTSADGCLDTGKVMVSISPMAILEMGEDVVVHEGESVQLFARGNCTVFKFTPNSYLDYDDISNPTVSGLNNTTRYIVSGATAYGCETVDTVNVIYDSTSVVTVANAFSPNGSEVNTLKPIKVGIFTLESFRIYNRWGELLFETDDLNEGWDGKFKGEPQPIGTYIYELQGRNKKDEVIRKNGTVTLIK